MSARIAVRCQAREKSHFAQHPGGIWPEHHARSDFAHLRGSFVDRHLNASLMKGNRRGDATDSASDDTDIDFRYGVNSSIEIICPETRLKFSSDVSSRDRGCTQSFETDCDHQGKVISWGQLKRTRP